MERVRTALLYASMPRSRPCGRLATASSPVESCSCVFSCHHQVTKSGLAGGGASPLHWSVRPWRLGTAALGAPYPASSFCLEVSGGRPATIFVSGRMGGIRDKMEPAEWAGLYLVFDEAQEFHGFHFMQVIRKRAPIIRSLPICDGWGDKFVMCGIQSQCAS